MEGITILKRVAIDRADVRDMGSMGRDMDRQKSLWGPGLSNMQVLSWWTVVTCLETWIWERRVEKRWE